MTNSSASRALVAGHSRFRIQPFRLERPSSVEQALSHIRQGATVMAGGVDLIDRMKSGFSPTSVVHIAHLKELKRIVLEEDRLYIGAGLTHFEISAHPEVIRLLPSLAIAFGKIGNIRVRLRGTLGGNLMAGVTAYDLPSILAAVDAKAIFRLTDGSFSEVPILEASSHSGLLIGVGILHPLEVRLVVERSLKDLALVAFAERSAADIRTVVGGRSNQPSVFIGEAAANPRVEGPNALYLNIVLPKLIKRMMHA